MLKESTKLLAFTFVFGMSNVEAAEDNDKDFFVKVAWCGQADVAAGKIASFKSASVS